MHTAHNNNEWEHVGDVKMQHSAKDKAINFSNDLIKIK